MRSRCASFGRDNFVKIFQLFKEQERFSKIIKDRTSRKTEAPRMKKDLLTVREIFFHIDHGDSIPAELKWL